MAFLLTLVAVGRVLLSYPDTAQAWDEPCHLACGMEWLDRGTYTLDRVHPPLSRIAIALPVYLAGERYPTPVVTDDLRDFPQYWPVGRALLYGNGHYLRNLFLARSGVLPFLLLAAMVVFLWTRRLFGARAGLAAVFLFTTLPIVLAFSGLAYTDFPAASLQFTSLFAFAMWVERPSLRRSLWLGIAVGLALLSKLTTLVFVPVAALAMVISKWFLDDRVKAEAAKEGVGWTKGIAVALLLACLIVWGGYRFSFGHFDEAFHISPSSMPSFQHFSRPAATLAQRMIAWNPRLPAPELLDGMVTTWVFTRREAPAYLLGRIKDGGWWYFFLAGIGVKTPLPFLILAAIGFLSFLRSGRRGPWASLAPAASALAVLITSMFVKYNAGLRHVLVVFPLLAIVAGFGAWKLWESEGGPYHWRRGLLVTLLLWQAVASYRARSDYIAYFNEIAGREPSRILTTGCDLECGQDLFRLGHALRDRHISFLRIALWSSADVSQMGLPSFAPLPPFQPVTGWVAIGLRSFRTRDVGPCCRTSQVEPLSRPTGEAYAWLNRYQPVERIGKTIDLYYIPPPEERNRQP